MNLKKAKQNDTVTQYENEKHMKMGKPQRGDILQLDD
jgi:hypothetical protein